MRVLISTRQGAGHIGPLIPFAHALLRNNDEVVVTAVANAAPMISAAGLDHHPIPDPPAEERDPIFARAKTLDPDEVRSEVGLDPDPRLERLAAIPCFSLIPKSLEDPGTEGTDRILRFRVEEPAPRPLPDWWANEEWPLVYVTFGTVVPTIGFYPDVYRAAIDALSSLPVRLLVTVGREQDPSELGPVAPNVHVARWIPQADVLPHAAAIVSHGGSGTVTGTLAAGVPAVVVPFIADQYDNARRVTELGAGLTLEADDIVRLPDAVRALLADGTYREAAGRVAAEVRALPTVDTATEILRRFAGA